jgi:hypothetical protein
MKLVLQHTNGAFGMEGVPEHAWRDGKEFRKVKTARAAKVEAINEMKQICGPNAWDRHYRIVNAGQLIRLEAYYECYGSYHTHEHAEGCHRELAIEYDWESGEPMPRAPFPKGWGAGNCVCPACKVIDDAFLAREYAAEDARRAKWERESALPYPY